MVAEIPAELLERALAADRVAVRALITRFLPVVEARVMRALSRRQKAQGRGRDARQELDDLTQEVMASLFADHARVLRSWDPARGLSLLNFVGLIAERQVAAVFRTGRRSPWTEDPTVSSELDVVASSEVAPDASLASREQLSVVVERLRERLSPLGLSLFYQLIVEDRPVSEVCASMQMSQDALYAWRSRLLKLVRKLAEELEDPAAMSEPAEALQRPVGDGQP